MKKRIKVVFMGFLCMSMVLAQRRTTESPVDADSIIRPIIEPIAMLFSEIDKNDRALKMAQRIEQQRKANSFDLESLMAALDPKEEPPTTPPSFLNKLFEPMFMSMKQDMEKFQNTLTTIAPVGTTIASKGLRPNETINSNHVRRAPASRNQQFRTKSNEDHSADMSLRKTDLLGFTLAPTKSFSGDLKISKMLTPILLDQSQTAPVTVSKPAIFPNIFEGKPFEAMKNLFPDLSKPETLLKHHPTLPALAPMTFPTAKPKSLMEYLIEEFKAEAVDPDDQNPLGSFTLKPGKIVNPFTLNPLMSMFTPPTPRLKIPDIPEIKGVPIHKFEQLPIFHQKPLILQDPFQNPLLPKRKNKLYDLLTGRSLPPAIDSFGSR